jgi:hypothetical protein
MTGEIFKRATIRSMVDYLIFGFPEERDDRDYETRLDEEYDKYEALLANCDEEQKARLLDAANAMASETASVYAEIGFLAGILLARDVDRRVGIDSM